MPRTPGAFDIDVSGAGNVTGLWYPAGSSRSLNTTIVLAHGAGAPQLSPFMTAFATGLSARGVDVVTFNFVYMEQGRRAPDPKARLEATYRSVVDATRHQVASAGTRLVIGGKSMGGRIADRSGSARSWRRGPCPARISSTPARATRATPGRALALDRLADALRAGQPRHVRNRRRNAAGGRRLPACRAPSRGWRRPFAQGSR